MAETTTSASFVALDVETAAASRASICQVAVAYFEEAASPRVWSTYVDPECDFGPINMHVHGIKPRHVQSVPTFPAIYPRIHAALDGQVVAQYSAFDSQAVKRSIERYCLPPLNCVWLDVCATAKLIWPHLCDRGFSLDKVAA